MTLPYDSYEDTVDHIVRVQDYLLDVMWRLRRRSMDHDLSKLEEPEKPLFDEMTPLLKDCEYGSEEYYGYLARLKPALDHHYAHNTHHPDHFEDGIQGMSLLDLIEMLVDWKAASERHATGDLAKSIEHNTQRFGISPDLRQILINTAQELGLF